MAPFNGICLFVISIMMGWVKDMLTIQQLQQTFFISFVIGLQWNNELTSSLSSRGQRNGDKSISDQ